jgi:hypothetical protein
MRGGRDAAALGRTVLDAHHVRPSSEWERCPILRILETRGNHPRVKATSRLLLLWCFVLNACSDGDDGSTGTATDGPGNSPEEPGDDPADPDGEPEGSPGNPVDEPTDVTDEQALANLPTNYADAYCDWAYRCCSAEQQAHWQGAPLNFLGGTEEECRPNMQALITLLLPEVTASDAAGRSVFNADSFEECLDLVRTTCVFDIEATCGEINEPKVGVGGACRQNFECIDAICLGESDDTDGVCAEPSAMGEPCDTDSDCESDHCDGSACYEGARNGATCFDDGDCTSGYCDFEASSCADAPFEETCQLE